MNNAPESVQILWPESSCQNCRHWATITQELKHLIDTGPGLATKTDPKLPALGHNYKNGTLSLARVWVLKFNQHCQHWDTITPIKVVHLAGSGPRLGTETEPTLVLNHVNT